MTHSFLGILVEGDIIRSRHRVKQRPLEEFTPLVQAVLDDELVTEFGWHQYTPYFNDGDECVFHAYSLWVRTVEDPSWDEVDDSEDLEIGCHHALSPRHWNPQLGRYEDVQRDSAKQATYDRCKALGDAIEGGAFDEVLLDAFGDHADITVRRSGITVGFYQHD